MRIHTRTVLDIETLEVLEDYFYQWIGDVSCCKGEAAKQQAQNNLLAQQQFQAQQEYLAKYNAYVDQLIKGGGYLPGVKEAQISEAINSVPQNYNQVAEQMMTTLGNRGATGGGSQPGSGLLGRGLGQLYSSEEQTKSKLLNDITATGQNNINAAEAGVLNAGLGTGNTGANLIGSATSAANAANQSSGLLGTIIGGGLGVLGSALGKGGALAGGGG